MPWSDNDSPCCSVIMDLGGAVRVDVQVVQKVQRVGALLDPVRGHLDKWLIFRKSSRRMERPRLKESTTKFRVRLDDISCCISHRQQQVQWNPVLTKVESISFTFFGGQRAVRMAGTWTLHKFLQSDQSVLYISWRWMAVSWAMNIDNCTTAWA